MEKQVHRVAGKGLLPNNGVSRQRSPRKGYCMHAVMHAGQLELMPYGIYSRVVPEGSSSTLTTLDFLLRAGRCKAGEACSWLRHVERRCSSLAFQASAAAATRHEISHDFQADMGMHLRIMQ